MFTNLSRRNQCLIERQLTLITELETSEADPDQLANLFKLDHLATRMRRNGENLLVLAGEEPGRRWDRPVPLVDVLRAAASEVEQYERIELTGVPDAEIDGRAVNRPRAPARRAAGERHRRSPRPQTKVRVTGHAAARRPGAWSRSTTSGIGLTRRGLRRHQRPAGQPADRGRRGLPAHGPVRGRPAGRPARHPRPAAPVRLRRRQRVRADPDRRAGQPVRPAGRGHRRRPAADGGRSGRPARPPGRAGACRPRPARSRRPGPRPLGPGPATDLPAPAARPPGRRPGRPTSRSRPARRRCRGAPRPRPPVATARAPAPSTARAARQPGRQLAAGERRDARQRAPSGRPVLPPGGHGPGRPGGPVPPGDQPVRPPLPMRGAPDAGVRPAARSRRSARRPAGPRAPARSTSRTRSRPAPRSARRSSSSCSRSGSGSGRRARGRPAAAGCAHARRCAGTPRPQPAPGPAGKRGSLGVPGRRGLAGGRAAAAADQRRHHPGRAADAGAAGPPHARRR